MSQLDGKKGTSLDILGLKLGTVFGCNFGIACLGVKVSMFHMQGWVFMDVLCQRLMILAQFQFIFIYQ